MEIREFIEVRLAEDELWAKAASAADRPERGTVEGGMHWTWSVGDNWDPVQPDPLEPFMGGYDGQWSQRVILRSVEEWHLGYGGEHNTLPLKIAESEELRTADGAHIVRHDPARVLREVAAKRAILKAYPADDHEPYVAFGDWESCSDSCPRRILDEVLKLLANAWSDHPDFDPAWRING